MPYRRYLRDELLRVRNSPHVKKPDNLPPIEQWIEYVYLDKDSREKLRIPHSEPQPKETPANKRKTQHTNGEAANASPMGNFSTGRPSLLSTREKGSRAGDDVVLGPPKMAFTSSSRLGRANGNGEATPTATDASVSESTDAARSRPTTDRQQNRKSANPLEKDPRDSWTSARDQRRVHAEPSEEQKDGNDRFSKFKKHERERDGEQTRGGDQQDTRWGRKDERRPNGERQGGWRDRENARQGQDKGWQRPERNEREPEWFDQPAPLHTQEHETSGDGAGHTAQDFEKWKASMREAERPTTSGNAALEFVAAQDKAQTKETKPLKLDQFPPSGFGGFGIQSPDMPMENAQPTKTPTAKGKASRFANVFNKKEEPLTPLPVDPPLMQPPVPTNASSNEERTQFESMLNMLKQTKIPKEAPSAQPAAEPTSPRVISNGSRQKSRFFDAAPKSPEMSQPMQSGFQSPQAHAGNLTAPPTRENTDSFRPTSSQPEPHQREYAARNQPVAAVASPEPGRAPNGHRASIPPQTRPNDFNGNVPPARNVATPDINIQNLLAAQGAQRSDAPDGNRNFLLGLLQGPASRPASQSQQPRPQHDFWIGQPPEPVAHPQPRAPPPPGRVDDQLLRHGMSESHRTEYPQQYRPQPEGGPRPMQHPPGFDEQTMAFQRQQHEAQQQQLHHRRTFTEPPQNPQQQPPNRRMSGHPNLPGMPHQPQPQFPPDFSYIQAPAGPHGPPPGFPGSRPPQQNFNFHSQQPPPPPGFPAGGMMQSPPPPPGFANGPPTGMPPGLMAMRSPVEGGVPGGAGFAGAGRGFGGFEGGPQRR